METVKLWEIFGCFKVRDIRDLQWADCRITAEKEMGVSVNGGTPKSSILIGVSIINHPFGGTPNFWKPPNEV